MGIIVTNRARFRRTMTVVGFIPFLVVAARIWVADRAFVLDLDSFAFGISATIATALFTTRREND